MDKKTGENWTQIRLVISNEIRWTVCDCWKEIKQNKRALRNQNQRNNVQETK